MKKKWVAFCLAASMLGAGTVFAKPAPAQLVPEKHGQCYTAEDLFVKDVNGAGGGMGVLHGEFAFRREQALGSDAIKEIGWMTLKKGASIGLHPHADNDDTYIIISGKGVFTGSDGKEIAVGPESVTIAGPGESHALRNDGDDDLVFIDVIAKNVPKAEKK